jgi:hypothetical protein
VLAGRMVTEQPSRNLTSSVSGGASTDTVCLATGSVGYAQLTISNSR